jgi:hypothetical protein
MHTRRPLLQLFAFVLVLSLSAGPAAAQSTGPDQPTGSPGPGFTYQGELDDSAGHPISAACDLSFSLWDSLSNPTGQVGGASTVSGVPVANGYFTVLVNAGGEFGPTAFAGPARWLAVAVRCPAGSGSYTTLAPRQPLTPAPYALTALRLQWGAVVTGTTGTGLSLWGGDTGLQGDGSRYGVFGLSEAITGTGVAGIAASLSGVSAGVYGLADSTAGFGVVGYTAAATGATRGVWGKSNSPQGFGVYGTAPITGTAGIATASSGIGVYGEALGSGGTGVSALATSNGVWGQATAAGGNGVVGIANNGPTAYGVWGSSSSGYAGYFSGNVLVNGNLSATGAKPFKIDNPLDPQHQYLYHYAVESPQVQNQYDGAVVLDAQGQAVVQLPAYFSAINAAGYTYCLTPIGAPMPNLYVAQEIQGNTFTIAGGVAGKKVSWVVYAQRSDPWLRDHPQPEVTDKPASEVGTYLYPRGYGQSETRAEDYARQQQALDQAAPSASGK